MNLYDYDIDESTFLGEFNIETLINIRVTIDDIYSNFKNKVLIKPKLINVLINKLINYTISNCYKFTTPELKSKNSFEDFMVSLSKLFNIYDTYKTKLCHKFDEDSIIFCEKNLFNGYYNFTLDKLIFLKLDNYFKKNEMKKKIKDLDIKHFYIIIEKFNKYLKNGVEYYDDLKKINTYLRYLFIKYLDFIRMTYDKITFKSYQVKDEGKIFVNKKIYIRFWVDFDEKL